MASMNQGGDFDDRLRKAQRTRQQSSEGGGRSTAIGTAFRLSTELVVGLVVGIGMGWLLDDWLGTSPWLLILFFFLGMAAGVLNVIRTAAAMNTANDSDTSVDQNRDE